ncbi:MAG: nickel-dependent hydrogenase large subunit [Archaeoglobaceae archaeon]|nr:nickel-dependent hydrogenase large subunit [Archaeoglobaceae archaeon]MCX8152415.1 nickel-dependent hydrogenase large subunit [Archaeoglobaceae archaeon]MDW8013755.1 nickel-dependent hydrogenase large subunit [Archaeoglobaceae archaeon]
MPEFSIDPITRIEGHLGIKLKIERSPALKNEYIVTESKVSGHMFRGFEIFLKGRDPRDAVYIVQRICGVCPTPHGMASVLALDEAFGAIPPPAAILIRNIIEGSSYLYDHLLHFYTLMGPELGILTAHLPMVPPVLGKEGIKRLNLGSHYSSNLRYIRIANEIQAIWGGKFPHVASLHPGGVTVKPTLDKISLSIARLVPLWEFIALVTMEDVKILLSRNERIKDVTENILGLRVGLENIGVGVGNFLAYGLFPEPEDYESDWLDPSKRRRSLFHSGFWSKGSFSPFDERKIREDVKNSYYDSPSGLHPSVGVTSPKKDKPGAYSWLKAPRYDGEPAEVGPLARMLVTFGRRWKVERIHPITGEDYGAVEYEVRNPNGSVLDRVVARAFNLMLIANSLFEWLLDLKNYLDKPVINYKDVPVTASGRGLWDAPRGALGHWITIKGGRIERYQCVVPSTWNWSPRDDRDVPGPGEIALTSRFKPELNAVWIPTMSVPDIANAVAPDLEIEWPAKIKGWGNILGSALTRINPKYARINMETATTREFVNSTIPLMIARSFDPCLACAVHLITPSGKELVVEVR